jgi:hypothetical protein
LIASVGLSATASARLLLGIGDESPAAFTNPYFQALGVKRTRLVTSYNSALAAPAGVDHWMAAARAANEQIVVAFNPGAGQHCPSRPCSLPSASQYTKAFRAFHKRYPFVTIYQPWNEVNSTTQPTWTNPQAVVTYYAIVKRYCKGCTVIGADLEDVVTPRKANYVVYIRQLLADFRKAKVPVPHLWGLHNYEDVNFFRSTDTAEILKLLPGQVWLTETGGIAFFETGALKVLLPYSEARQDRATDWMIKLALRYPMRIARVYIYNFLNGGPYGPSNRFDSALLETTGAPRPAWFALYVHDRSYFK